MLGLLVSVPTPVDSVDRPGMTPVIRAREARLRSFQECRSHLRVHGLPRRHRRSLRGGAGKVQRREIQCRFLLRLQFEAHQPRRQDPLLPTIRKITSGSMAEAAEAVHGL